jgi:hypothetical protein
MALIHTIALAVQGLLTTGVCATDTGDVRKRRLQTKIRLQAAHLRNPFANAQTVAVYGST